MFKPFWPFYIAVTLAILGGFFLTRALFFLALGVFLAILWDMYFLWRKDNKVNQLLEDLRATRAAIDTPEKWAKNNYWYDKYGLSLDEREDATCDEVCTMCVLGAAFCATGSNPTLEGEDLRWWDITEALKRALPAGWFSVPNFNDSEDTTYEDVIAMIDRAIKTEEERDAE